MSVRRIVSVPLAVVACVAVPSAVAASKASTVAPSATQRSAILKAFGERRAGWPCMTVRLAASNRDYASVRPSFSKACQRYAFNGTNVIKRTSDNHWKVLFEGSAYACPLAKIPRQVQRDLGVCR